MAIGTTAAILGSAALGAGGSALAARSASNASRNAANAVQQSNDASVAEQRRQYDLSRGDNAPWLATGNAALSQLAGLYGLSTGGGGANSDTYAFLQANPQAREAINAGYFGGPGDLNSAVNWYRNEYGGASNPTTTGGVPGGAGGTAGIGGAAGATAAPGVTAGGANMGAFFASPDYQFRQDEQNRELTARNARLGIQDSGAAQKASMKYSGNLASGEFNNYANRLASIAGVGQTAASQNQALGTNYANALTGINQNTGQALASSYQQQGAISSGLTQNLAGIGTSLLNNWPSSGGGWGGSSLPNSAFRW